MASMRPQHIAAENREKTNSPAQRDSFNEAAAYRCGKRRLTWRACANFGGFNEAAAYRCGKRGGVRAVDRLRRASMRPQHIAAENAAGRRQPVRRPGGFNEAAAYRCGKPGTSRSSRPRHPARFNEAAAYRCGKRLGPFKLLHAVCSRLQ